MKIYVAHSNSFDFQNELYNPIKTSNLFENNEFIFPHDNDEWANSKEQIKNSDIIIAEVSYPSIGLGIELGWADMFGIPIVCIHTENESPTRSLAAVSSLILPYNKENLITIIQEGLAKLERD